MTAVAGLRPVTADPAPARAVTALALRQVRGGALVVTGVVAGMSLLVAGTYRATVADTLDAAELTALAANPAVRTLFGEPVALTDPGGFTAWRTGTVLAVLVGVWATLTATRVTRGEEDAGRWDLLLSGRVPLPVVVARHTAVVVGAVLITGAATALALVAAGTAASGAVLHGAGVALVGAFFAAAGALAAQLLPSRAAASGATVALLGAALLARMVGDGLDALAWLRWLTPFGLVALVRPFEANRVTPLLVLALAAAALGVAAAAAARRDLRGGWVAPRSARAAQPRLLGSPEAFAVRRLLRPLAGWSAGIGVYFLLIGFLTVSITRFLTENPRFATLAAQAGFGGLGSVEGYAAALFTLLAVPVGVFAATRIAATSAAEAGRLLTLVLAGPVTRLRLLGAEVTAAAAGAVGLAAVAGLAMWAGAVIVEAPLPLAAALAGGFNVLPVALLGLGAAVLALGWTPRAVALVGALPPAGGFVLLVLADSTGAPGWVRELSPFAHLAAVPDAAPDVAGGAGVILVAGALMVAGALGYRRRDLRG